MSLHKELIKGVHTMLCLCAHNVMSTVHFNRFMQCCCVDLHFTNIRIIHSLPDSGISTSSTCVVNNSPDPQSCGLNRSDTSHDPCNTLETLDSESPSKKRKVEVPSEEKQQNETFKSFFAKK